MSWWSRENSSIRPTMSVVETPSVRGIVRYLPRSIAFWYTFCGQRHQLRGRAAERRCVAAAPCHRRCTGRRRAQRSRSCTCRRSWSGTRRSSRTGTRAPPARATRASATQIDRRGGHNGGGPHRRICSLARSRAARRRSSASTASLVRLNAAHGRGGHAGAHHWGGALALLDRRWQQQRHRGVSEPGAREPHERCAPSLLTPTTRYVPSARPCRNAFM